MLHRRLASCLAALLIGCAAPQKTERSADAASKAPASTATPGLARVTVWLGGVHCLF